MRFRDFFLGFFFSWFLLATASLEATNSWKVHSVANGLPGNNVHTLAVCRSKMAVGTDNGLAIYDGLQCKWSIPALPPDIASVSINDLAYDKFNNLWMATPKGVGVLQKGSIEWFTTNDGLPTIDTERLQVLGEEVFVGTFGGFVSKAFTPQNGRTSFSAVNYKPKTSEEEALRLRSIGITGLAMKNSVEGWFSTKGGGLVLNQGLSQYVIDRDRGLASDWVEAFWMFTGQQNAQHILAATTNGLNLIRDLTVVGFFQVPVKSDATWISSLVTTPPFDGKEEPRKGENKDWDLATFLGNRTLWVGTKFEGLLRYEGGQWTQYTPDNSLLPSKIINRLYYHMGRIMVCTTEGLVIIPLAAHAFDEFSVLGIGGNICKTILPNYNPCGIVCMDKRADFWVGTEEGLCRFIPAPGVADAVLEDAANLSASMEETKPKDQGSEDSVVKIVGGESRWERFSTKRRNLFSDNISSLCCDHLGNTWVIFDNKILARVRVVPLAKTAKEKHVRKEKYVWDILSQEQVPWRIGLKLNIVWSHDGAVYIGTKGMGFYILKNPSGRVAGGERKFVWENFCQTQGLWEENVIGFAAQIVPDSTPRVALLHPDGATLWDRVNFTSVSFDAKRTYTCVAGDSQGNLWFGSDGGGVIRLTPDAKILTYTRGNAWFESNKITAILAPPHQTLGGSLGIWVACDEKHGNLDELAPGGKWNPNPSRIIADPPGASLHYYDGLTWDKWGVPGIRCMLGDADYLWVGTNFRLRRFYLPMLMSEGGSP